MVMVGQCEREVLIFFGLNIAHQIGQRRINAIQEPRLIEQMEMHRPFHRSGAGQHRFGAHRGGQPAERGPADGPDGQGSAGFCASFRHSLSESQPVSFLVT